MWTLLAIWACSSGPTLKDTASPGTGSSSTTPTNPSTTDTSSTTSTPDGCHWVDEPTLVDPPSDRMHLVQVLEATSSEPGALTLSLDGVIVGQWPSATEHRVPVLQLRPDTTHTVEATLDCGD